MAGFFSTTATSRPRVGGGEQREVLRLDGETYRLVVTFAGDEPVRAEPFDAIELDLGALWAR